MNIIYTYIFIHVYIPSGVGYYSFLLWENDILSGDVKLQDKNLHFNEIPKISNNGFILAKLMLFVLKARVKEKKRMFNVFIQVSLQNYYINSEGSPKTMKY